MPFLKKQRFYLWGVTKSHTVNARWAKQCICPPGYLRFNRKIRMFSKIAARFYPRDKETVIKNASETYIPRKLISLIAKLFACVSQKNVL